MDLSDKMLDKNREAKTQNLYKKNNNFWEQVRNWKRKNWEISMHGYTHVYDQETNMKDFFNYGGRSEFYGHSYEEQFSRIKKVY